MSQITSNLLLLFICFVICLAVGVLPIYFIVKKVCKKYDLNFAEYRRVLIITFLTTFLCQILLKLLPRIL